MISTGIVRRFLRKKLSKYKPLIEVEISEGALLNNYNTAKDEAKKEIVPVLKSNAYGHGLWEVASIMEKTDAPFLVVDSLFEVIALRKNGIKKPILVIGYAEPDNIKEIRVKDTSFAIVSKTQLKEVAALSKTVKIHLKVDTGMSRQGVNVEELEEALEIVKRSKNIKLEGVYSHFAEAEEERSERTELQKERWVSTLRKVKAQFGEVKYKHIAATTGIKEVSELDLNIVRLGIGLYGVDPARKMQNRLKSTIKITAPITNIKTIKQGEWVGYGATHKTEENIQIGILPMGYYEGINRERSNNGMVAYKKELFPIIGRVSMNMTTIEIPESTEAHIGERVVVLGGEHEETGVIAVAEKTGKIPYEIFVGIPQHLRRRITK